jgi:ABC-2 type transport system ATP-binding protein
LESKQIEHRLDLGVSVLLGDGCCCQRTWPSIISIEGLPEGDQDKAIGRFDCDDWCDLLSQPAIGESRTSSDDDDRGAADTLGGGPRLNAHLRTGLDVDVASTLTVVSETTRREAEVTTNQVGGPAIRVQGLAKSFEKLEVLRGVDFEVERGTIFALLGSNGAGKTTTIRILSTLLGADAGSASVNGFDVDAQGAEVRESISLTGQFAAVDEILTGRENLVLVARLRHLEDPTGIADGLLDRFGLADAGMRRVAAYSGGMRRRLDIAMSLIGDPPVIFLDEPTAGLDPQARREVWQAVKDLAGRGTTVLLTTQYLEEAEQLADRIGILHGGRIIVDGTLAELKKLLPPVVVEYVEKQPTLEDVFLAVVGNDANSIDEQGDG